MVVLGLLVLVQGDIREAEERRSNSARLADDLRQSSDDLTRMARLYVSTGEPRYRDHFEEIVAIRNGSTPRPDRYDLVYWDLVGPDDVRPRGAGEARALEDLMIEAGITDKEFGLLREAEARSNALTLIENVAMDAVEAGSGTDLGQPDVEGVPDLEMARELMFGHEYMAHKAAIMGPINKFLVVLEQRTERDVGSLSDHAADLGWMALVLSASAISLSLLTGWMVRRRVLAPLAILQSNAAAIGEGDYSQQVAYESNDEFGDLAAAHAEMQRRLGETMVELVEERRELEVEVLARTSELRRTVDLLEKSSERLEQSNQELHELASDRETARLALEEMLRSKNALIATVSHELRTPLTGMLGFARVLHDPASDLSVEDRAELRQSIIDEGTDLANIVDDLLVAARAATQTLSIARDTVDLRTQIAQVLESERPEIAGPIEAPSGAVNVLGDSARVRQILRNLISNAVRYGGSTIRIDLGGDDATALLAVADDGPGVLAEEQHQIFEPYWQAHQVRGTPLSLGLGLSLSRDLARLMGGDLVYRREADETIFELSLPRAD